MSVKEFYERYHNNYKVVLADIEAHPTWYRSVNMRACEKKYIFEKFNYYEQFGKDWPYESKLPKPSPLKRLFPAKFKVLHGAFHEVDTLIWMAKKRSNLTLFGPILDYKQNEMLFSASKAPKLAFRCLMDGVNYYQHEARGLHNQIDSFYELLEKFPLKEIHLDEDISPDKNALCQVARIMGVTTTVHCHGQLGVITGFLPLTADFMSIKLVEQKKKLIAWGLEPFRIITKDSTLNQAS